MASNPRVTPAGNFFGNTDFTDPTAASQAAGKAATTTFGQGLDLSKLGAEGLGPVFQKLLKLVSGDATSVNEATMPENDAILRQFDTALRSAANFSPRGGGLTSGAISLRTQEASQLATTKSNAITEATKELGTLASTTTGQGLQAQLGSMQELGNLVQAAMQGAADKRSMWLSIGKIVGAAALTYFTGGAASPLLAGALASTSTASNVGGLASDPSGGSGVGPGLAALFGNN